MKNLLLLTIVILLTSCSGFKFPVQKHVIEIPGLVNKIEVDNTSITQRRFECIDHFLTKGASQKRIVGYCESIYGEID